MTENLDTQNTDTQSIAVPIESPVTPQETLPEASMAPKEASLESSFGSMPGEVSLRGSSFDEEVAPTVQRVLTPEQREQKNLRSRERRAAKAGEVEEIVSVMTAPIKEMTQAERDMPYRKALSARIQADDHARAQRIQESQQRLAARKPLANNR